MDCGTRNTSNQSHKLVTNKKLQLASIISHAFKVSSTQGTRLFDKIMFDLFECPELFFFKFNQKEKKKRKMQ